MELKDPNWRSFDSGLEPDRVEKIKEEKTWCDPTNPVKNPAATR